MSDDATNPFDPKNLALGPELWVVVPTKIKKRHKHFVKVPWTWMEKLSRTRSANTYRVALYLLFLHWKGNGDPIKLANGMLAMDRVTRFSKWRALRELEQAGLIGIERRPKKSPTIRVVV